MRSTHGDQVVKKESQSPRTTCVELNAVVQSDYRATESSRASIPAPSLPKGTEQWKTRQEVVPRSPDSGGRYLAPVEQVERHFPQQLPSLHTLLSSTGLPNGSFQHWHRASYPGPVYPAATLPNSRRETNSTSPPSHSAPSTEFALTSFSSRERHKLPPLDSLTGNRARAYDSAHSRTTRSPDRTLSHTQNATTYNHFHFQTPLQGPEVSYRRSPSLPFHNSASHSHDSSNQIGSDRSPATVNVDRTTSPGLASVSHYVGRRVVPGEGLCHVYDDGTFCQAVIAGEPVNPDFGVTKAGRPRKRLAKACTTCREKKIKCEPGFPKCTSCQKLNRDCTWLPHQRPRPESNHSGSGAETTSAGEGASEYDRRRPRSSKRSPPRDDSVSPHESLSSAEPPAPKSASQNQSKRRRSHVQLHRRSNGVQNSDDADSTDSLKIDQVFGHSDALATSQFGWDLDPYRASQVITLQLLDLYFLYVCGGPHIMFPRDQFTQWVTKCDSKSEEDRMVLYAVLAVGAVFSPHTFLKELGEQLAEISMYAEKRNFGKFSLQLAQTRIYLSLQRFTSGRYAEAREFSGSAVQACRGLGLEVESGIQNIPEIRTGYAYGLNRVQLADCRRRAFWLAYSIDHYNEHVSGYRAVLHDQDIFTRLPIPEENYHRGIDVETPVFGDKISSSSPENTPPISAMGLLVILSSIWAEVVADVHRSVHRANAEYQEHYQRTYASTQQRLTEWRSTLPPHLKFSFNNTHTSIKDGYFATYFQLHAVYFGSEMKLHRWGRHDLLEPAIVRRNVRAAHQYARKMLSMVTPLRGVNVADCKADIALAMSQPTPRHVIMSALDIASSGGESGCLSEVISLFADAMSVVKDVGKHWCDSHALVDIIQNRQIKLTGACMRIKDMTNWRIECPLHPESSLPPKDHDQIYGVPMEVFHNATKGLFKDIQEQSPTVEPKESFDVIP